MDDPVPLIQGAFESVTAFVYVGLGIQGTKQFCKYACMLLSKFIKYF